MIRALRFVVALLFAAQIWAAVACSEPLRLPMSDTVLSSWGGSSADPKVLVLDTRIDTVVTRGTHVLVQGNFKGSHTKAIEFYVERTLVAKHDFDGVYQFKWDTSGEDGPRRLKVVELQADGQRYVIEKANVEVVSRSPISLTGLVAGAKLLDPTLVKCDTQSGYGVRNVKLYANGTPVGSIGTDGLIWNVPVMPSGTYQLWLEADSARGTLRSSPIQVSIPDRVLMAWPTDNEKLTVGASSTNLKLSADVHAGVSIKKVEFACAGARIAESTGAAKEAEWNTDDVAPGKYKLTARVVDQADHTYESAPVTVYLDNPPYRQRQAEAGARQRQRQAEFAAEERQAQERLAREEGDARKKYWENKSVPYSGTTVKLEMTDLRHAGNQFLAGLRIDNGSRSPVVLQFVWLVFDDYSSEILVAFDGLDKNSVPVILPIDVWRSFYLASGRSVALDLYTLELPHEARKPKNLRVKVNGTDIKVALP